MALPTTQRTISEDIEFEISAPSRTPRCSESASIPKVEVAERRNVGGTDADAQENEIQVGVWPRSSK